MHRGCMAGLSDKEYSRDLLTISLIYRDEPSAVNYRKFLGKF